MKKMWKKALALMLALLMVVNILLINGMFAYKKKHIE